MSEQGFSRNVEQGTSANISAPAWNKVTSFVDEVANSTSRTLRVTPQTKTPSPEGRLVSLVKADEDIETGDFLSMTGVNIDSTQNDQYFKYHGVPTVEKMGGSPKSICVAMQPIKSGKYGRACITGICVAKVNSPTAATYDFYDADGSTTAGTAPLTNDDTGLRVIWSDGTSGDSLALVAVNLAGSGNGIAPMIPVDLTQVGGSQGDNTASASWTYDVFLASERGTGPTAILTGVDPTSSPHQFRRPNLGQMEKATFGWVWQLADDSYEIGWINEAIIAAECEEEAP